MISTDERYPKKKADVLGKKMAYVEVGEGDPILFLHGNPTSSYLWRNVIPHMEKLGRCIAPDLIGMGDSDKLDDSGPDRYRFVEHRKYLDALLDQLGVHQNVTIVGHGRLQPDADDVSSAVGIGEVQHRRQRVVDHAELGAGAVVRPELLAVTGCVVKRDRRAVRTTIRHGAIDHKWVLCMRWCYRHQTKQ